MDRFGRFLLGCVWIAVAFQSVALDLDRTVFFWLPYWTGIFALITCYLGRCPVYRALNTYS